MIFKIASKHILSKPLVTALTLFAIAGTLTILGAFWTVVENLDRVRASSQENAALEPKAGVTLFIDAKAPASEIDDLKAKFKADKRFMQLEVVDSAAAIKSLESQFPETLGQVLQSDSLPMSFRLGFSKDTMTRDEYVSLMNELRSLPIVLDVDDGRVLSPTGKSALSSRVFTWANALLGLIFCIVALLVSHLIRIAFESLKFEIETMKILGAGRFWIFKPLLIEGLFFGLAGALTALLILAISVKWFLPYFAEVFLPKGVMVSSLSGQASLLLLGLSVVASCVGAFLTFPLVSAAPKEA